MVEEKIAVITDSCADVPKEYREKYDIHVLPMVIQCKDGAYKDGVDIQAEDVYERNKSELLRTSSPEGGDILNLFEKLAKDGYTHALAIMLSSGLSGTYNQIRMMAEDFEDMVIKVVDSKQASIGVGAIAAQVAEYAKEGMKFETLFNRTTELVKKTKVFFSIQNLDLLQKGGRIGKVTATLGSALNIKPVLAFDSEEGQIYSAAMVRGTKKLPAKLIELVNEFDGVVDETRKFNIMVADGGAKELGDKLAETVKEKFPGYYNFYRAKIGAALSVYLGDGLLGMGIQYLD